MRAWSAVAAATAFVCWFAAETYKGGSCGYRTPGNPSVTCGTRGSPSASATSRQRS
jgi:hypothetical protein